MKTLEKALNSGFVNELEEIIPADRILKHPAELYAYGADASIHRKTPQIVAVVLSAEEVSQVLKLANKHLVPVTPRGAGTAMCGHAIPLHGGLVLDMQRMNKIREIRVQDLYCVVEPGVVYAALNDALKPHKFFFPPDPGSGEACTIGGMVVCNASGVHAIKYGATRDYILGVEAVMPTGEIVHLGTRTLKSASGYQFERLLPASEGTLAVVTEVTLKVVPLPKKKAMAMAAFDNLETAGKCVSNIIAHPILPASLELMDSICIKAVNKAMKMSLPEAEALCFIEVDGHPGSVAEEIESVASVAKATGAISVEFTDDAKKIEELQKARKGMIPSLSKYRPDLVTVMLADDMAVPISKVPDAVKAFHRVAEKYGVLIPTYGHAGDGNLHTKFLIDPLKKEQWDAAEKATEEVFEEVLKLGGTITGEHGISITKAPFYRKERADMIEFSKKLKRLFDPNNILNPGKMMDYEEGIIAHLRYPVGDRPPGKFTTLGKHAWDLHSCTYCGFCKSVCPIFTQKIQDTCVARGKVVLSYGILQGDVPLDAHTAERLFQCTGCMDCTRRCPSGIDIVPIVESARAEAVKAGFAMENHKALVKNVMESGNIYGDPSSFIEPQQGEVLLYVGCQFASRTNMTRKILKVLKALGVKPRIEKETCCGFTLKNLGFTEDFEKQKERFLEKFGNYKGQPIYALCPTCQAFIKEEYGFDCAHVLTLVEKLMASASPAKSEGTVTYHDPCHFSRILGFTETPRNLIKSLGFAIKEMELKGNVSRCCGGGGGLLVTDMPLSDAIAADRVRQAAKTGAAVIVTPCPTCEVTLKKSAAARKWEPGETPMTVKNLWDLLLAALK
ncbi:MAG: FAD-linked oxidase C-terminal domain-containing protein [Candidatus Eremiobacteraeota bacterium]|nr:FAD-linked oxidase C-terminal domain-containing protein [Candidatus Eremiobacteraeota bacterium]